MEISHLRLEDIKQKCSQYLNQAMLIIEPSHRQYYSYVAMAVPLWMLLLGGLSYGIVIVKEDIAHVEESYASLEILQQSLVQEKDSGTYKMFQHISQAMEDRARLKDKVMDILSNEPIMVLSLQEKEQKNRVIVHFSYSSDFRESMETWSALLEKLPYCETVLTEMHDKEGKILTKGYVAI